MMLMKFQQWIAVTDSCWPYSSLNTISFHAGLWIGFYNQRAIRVLCSKRKFSFYDKKEDASEIAEENIERVINVKILTDLESSFSSISFDEADIQKAEYLAVNSRYFASKDSRHTTTKLIGLIQLGSSVSGEVLY